MRETVPNAVERGLAELPPDRLAIRHILVPLDFSGMSRQALLSAVPLARRHGAKISLIHVCLPPMVTESYPDGGIVVPISSERLLKGANAHLQLLATQLLPRDLRGETLVREGNPAYEIVQAAEGLKVDLIVVSTTGSSGLRRVLLGSTAERIVRHAHCPVLTVRRRPAPRKKKKASEDAASYPDELPWRRILVPLDFSETSLQALRVAVPLARESGAQLFLLNVIQPHIYPPWMEGDVLVTNQDLVIGRAKTELPRIAHRFVPAEVKANTIIGHGQAAPEIIRTSERKRIDLIVLSTHGHTGIDRLLLGSTAEHVVRRAKCPVFVVRETN
jgi:nucleotide-binding universal stress UspA family protein